MSTEWEVITGDCLEVLPTLADSSIDLILTDPPYFKVKNLPWDRQWDTAAGYLAWLDLVLAEFYRVLKPNGSLYLFASPKMAARVEVLTGGRFNVLNQIVWLKELDRGTHAASCKEILRGYFPNTERIIFAEHHGADGYAKGEAGYGAKCDELRGFVFEPLRAYLDGERQRAGVSKAAANKLFDGPNVGQYWWQVRNFQLPTAENYEILRAGLSRLNHGGEYLRREYEDLRREYEDLRREYEDLRRPFNVTADVPYTDVWTFSTVQAYPGKHPAEKPQALLRHIIEASSKPGAVILDAFAGSGATGIAAQGAGRGFVGIEKDEHWAGYARARIAKAAEQARQAELPL